MGRDGSSFINDESLTIATDWRSLISRVSTIVIALTAIAIENIRKSFFTLGRITERIREIKEVFGHLLKIQNLRSLELIIVIGQR